MLGFFIKMKSLKILIFSLDTGQHLKTLTNQEDIISIQVAFGEINSSSNISLRVYERGVGETQACGTGACAAVVYGVENNLLNNKVRVSLPGGDLEINYKKGSDVLMTGPAEFVFKGSIEI